MSDALDELVRMSKTLGEPANDYVILGEGNTSTRADDDTFWVKASGTQLSQACRDSFVRVHFSPILAALDSPGMGDEAIKRLLKSSTVQSNRSPSIETFLHALCLQLEGPTSKQPKKAQNSARSNRRVHNRWARRHPAPVHQRRTGMAGGCPQYLIPNTQYPIPNTQYQLREEQWNANNLSK